MRAKYLQMANVGSDNFYLVDGSFDFSGGVDSSKVTTVASELHPNGLGRNQLAWLNNASVRTCGATQRTGWIRRIEEIVPKGYWQGGTIYTPDNGEPYIICQISGAIYKITISEPYEVTNLSVKFGLFNPSIPEIAEMAWFCQGEHILVIQAGDFYTTEPPHTLPLFWNGTALRRSIGVTNPAPAIAPGQNEIPAATCMDYYGSRFWYARGRMIAAGDMAGGPSGTLANAYRDSIINVTENPLCFGGDGLAMPTNSGNIRAIKHSAQLNASLGQGQLYIATRKAIYELTVPVTRNDWINADAKNQPQLTVVQLVNGAVSDRSVVPMNGDLYYLSLDPAVRSLKRAVAYFDTPGNTAISQNEQRVIQLTDRGLMRFSSGVEFDSRLLWLALPQRSVAKNVVHPAIMPLDFDVVTNFESRKNPVWEGVYDGRAWIQLLGCDFGGLQRAFGISIGDTGTALQLWELTHDEKRDADDNRVIWGLETPAFTWASSGYEFRLKQLKGGEVWVDRIFGTVFVDSYYRTDSDPCWRMWSRCELCVERCEDREDWDSAYPCTDAGEGYRFPISLPEPPVANDSMGIRPTTIGYQFQVKLVIKGWCRVRGILLYALPRGKQQYEGLCCSPSKKIGMAELPNPFENT